MVKYKKNLKNGIDLRDKLLGVKETCGQSSWVLAVGGGIVAVSSLLSFFAVFEARIYVDIVNSALGVIGLVVGTRGIKRVRKIVLK